MYLNKKKLWFIVCLEILYNCYKHFIIYTGKLGKLQDF